MTEFITRVCRAEESYEVIIKTDSADHYEAAQAFARRLIGHAKPMTNEDRLRAMSDEELADFLRKESWKCDNYKVCRECPRYIGDCCLPLDEWLQQPAEGDA